MITCPSCEHQELVGALFCNECGTRLTFTQSAPLSSKAELHTDKLGKNAMPHEAPFATPIDGDDFPFSSGILVSLRIISTGSVIHLESGEEFTLGRISGNQPILPDVDLTPFNAYEDGVSRLHATMKVNPKAITITDLGSANGTRINGKKIGAHDPKPLKNGDMITLGKFKVQVLIHK